MASCNLPLSNQRSAVTFFSRPVAELGAGLLLAFPTGLELDTISMGLLTCLVPLMTRPTLELKLKPVLARLPLLAAPRESGLAGVGPGTLPNPRELVSDPKVEVPITDCGRLVDRSEFPNDVGTLAEPVTPGIL